MQAIQITCPQCGRGLKIKDRSLLGKKGRCPSCAHAFVLNAVEEPEVELQLAGDVPVGTSAQWVPDAPPSPGPAEPPLTVVPAATVPVSIESAAATGSATARLQELRRRQKQRRRVAIVAGGVCAVIGFGAFLFVRSRIGDTPASAANATTTSGAAPVVEANGPTFALPAAEVIGDVWTATAAQLKTNEELVAAARPTQGEPIQLFMLPSGVNFVIHLRPARLWSNEPAYQELRATLTQNVTDWITEKLRSVCRREPAQIDEALIGVILGARGTEPQYAAVVRLVEDAKLSDLIEEFRGEPLVEEGGVRLYRAQDYAYLIRDTRNYAICPAGMGAELAEWIGQANYHTTDGILDLLRHTDRERLFTVVMEVDDVRRHQAALFTPEAGAAIARVLDAVSDDAETLAWSVHLGDTFHSELQLRTRVAGTREIVTPGRLAKSVNDTLAQAPHDVLAMIRKMHPQRKGTAAVLARYPAMLEAYRQATVPTTGARRVALTTVLPARSAPNLTLGTLLAWDEARRTDFTTSAPPATVAAADSGTKLPETVAERLQLPVEVEFERTPLHEAFTYLCGEIGVTLVIDGNALEDGAYTQNMPQTFNLGRVSAATAIHEIIKPNVGGGDDEKRMVVAVDEATKTLTVTTRKFARAKGPTEFNVAPAP